jgi:hypothetical protein
VSTGVDRLQTKVLEYLLADLDFLFQQPAMAIREATTALVQREGSGD